MMILFVVLPKLRLLVADCLATRDALYCLLLCVFAAVIEVAAILEPVVVTIELRPFSSGLLFYEADDVA